MVIGKTGCGPAHVDPGDWASAWLEMCRDLDIREHGINIGVGRRATPKTVAACAVIEASCEVGLS